MRLHNESSVSETRFKFHSSQLSTVSRKNATPNWFGRRTRYHSNGVLAEHLLNELINRWTAAVAAAAAEWHNSELVDDATSDRAAPIKRRAERTCLKATCDQWSGETARWRTATSTPMLSCVAPAEATKHRRSLSPDKARRRSAIAIKWPVVQSTVLSIIVVLLYNYVHRNTVEIFS